jgi:solute carrier family 26 (sodium-independent sulfate anion transporter), member 11
MAYAKLAQLPPEYGLYRWNSPHSSICLDVASFWKRPTSGSSFVGVIVYWFFATSKDITIGPVAVMSQLTGTIILNIQAKDSAYTGPQIASALAILGGAFIFVLGAARLGFIVDFIPLPAIAAFMTGSALNIASGQVSTMLGEVNVNTRSATYLVIIDTLNVCIRLLIWLAPGSIWPIRMQKLPSAGIDAAMGVSAMMMLYIIRSACTYISRKRPHQARLWFFVSTLRTVFVILLYTMISWRACLVSGLLVQCWWTVRLFEVVNMNRKGNPLFKILGTVPRGFTHMGVPTVTYGLVRDLAPELPGAIIVMLIEHIAISKSFGRVKWAHSLHEQPWVGIDWWDKIATTQSTRRKSLLLSVSPIS